MNSIHPLRKLQAYILLSCVVIVSGYGLSLPAQSEYVIGTYCTVNLFEKGSRAAYRELFARLREIDQHMSVHIEGSDVDRINRNAGIAPVTVHRDVMELMLKAREYAELTEGAFDPSIGPLVALWGIGTDAARVPDPSRIQELLPLVDWQRVQLDVNKNTVFLEKPGMMLDLGAIAKGYAADELAAIISRLNIPRAIIDLGGNILAYGSKDGDKAWRIGIQNPTNQRGEYMAVLEVKNKTVVTSGIYERFFVEDGQRYHHILSVHDGYPVENRVLSVTIVADSSTDADALSTGVFAMGYQKGQQLIESLSGVDAVWIFDNYSIRVSSGLKDSFSLMDTDFNESGPIPSQR